MERVAQKKNFRIGGIHIINNKKMNLVERVSEIIRYSIPSTEHSISPQSGLSYRLQAIISFINERIVEQNEYNV